MKKLISLSIFVLLGLCSLAASGQTNQKYIGMSKAKKIASKQAPGKITSSELEKEKGKMIYSFDIKGSDGKNHEVNIDAVSGAVIANEIETRADEAKEKEADKKSKKH